ncbi:MAG: YdcF family protein [Pseudomonadota bacterium]|nr:YdcF family protein [Pseudomonadota bacterium]
MVGLQSIGFGFIFKVIKWLGLVAILGYIVILTWLAAQADLLQRDVIRPADAIVVFGARAYINGNINRCLAARVERAAELYHAGQAPYLLMSGGIDPEDGVSEADTMQMLAMRYGVPADRIWRERESTSTYANLKLSQPILQQMKAERVLLVSDRFHVARIHQLAQAQGYTQFQVVSADQSPCQTETILRLRATSREPLAIVKNALKGYF